MLRDRNHDPHAPIDLESNQADMQEEALAIYRWWKYQKPKDEKRLDELFLPTSGPKGGAEDKAVKIFRRLESKIANDEQKMLHRLIDIRQGLWT